MGGCQAVLFSLLRFHQINSICLRRHYITLYYKTCNKSFARIFLWNLLRRKKKRNDNVPYHVRQHILPQRFDSRIRGRCGSRSWDCSILPIRLHQNKATNNPWSFPLLGFKHTGRMGISQRHGSCSQPESHDPIPNVPC